MSKSRIKSAAAAHVAQSESDVINLIKTLGDTERELKRTETEMNDQIAAITKKSAPRVKELQATIKALQSSIQPWCESNRAALTNGNKVKTAKFITGEVQWRKCPPSVRLTKKVQIVLEALKARKLIRFIRTKEEINKDAILADQNAARDIPGLKINTGDEEFVITPFEQELK